ncbi:hypothetical protein I4U23_005949 [Adineta vaga]|nr:hypothetical protein I4U23_005949 [Adineta vaga]
MPRVITTSIRPFSERSCGKLDLPPTNNPIITSSILSARKQRHEERQKRVLNKSTREIPIEFTVNNNDQSHSSPPPPVISSAIVHPASLNEILRENKKSYDKRKKSNWWNCFRCFAE